MKIAIQGDSMLDDDTRRHIAGAPERVLGRLRRRVAELHLRIEPVARTGKTLCQVTVRTAGRVQVLASDRDLDARSAVLNALRRTRNQVGRALRRRRASPGASPA